MAFYIDANAVVLEIEKNKCGLEDYDSALDVAISEIKTFKTADVVEVVRCKDCLFGHRCFQVIHGISDSWVECQNPDGLNRTVSDNGFCSASIKRREDGE